MEQQPTPWRHEPMLGRLETLYRKGVRSGAVRAERVRNRDRRIRRDRASGMRYRDLCIKYEMARSHLDGICHRRPQRVPIDMELDPSIAHLPPTSPTIRQAVKADHAKGANYKHAGREVRPHALPALHHRSRPAGRPRKGRRLTMLGNLRKLACFAGAHRAPARYYPVSRELKHLCTRPSCGKRTRSNVHLAA